MGEMADYCNELQEEGGRYFGGGDPYRNYVPMRPAPRCKRCGAACKWQTNENGKWQLFDLARGERNQNITHSCSQPSVDDFEVL